MPTTAIIPLKKIENAIYILRGQKIMLDEDLAELYEVPVKRLNEGVRRNSERFPKDFMFKISRRELDSIQSLRSQFATSNNSRGGRRYLPMAFTEHGILMLSSVLRSKRAVQVNIEIMRAFVEIRKMILSHSDLCRRIDALESRYDEQFRIVFDAIRKLLTPDTPPENERRIGFRTHNDE